VAKLEKLVGNYLATLSVEAPGKVSISWTSGGKKLRALPQTARKQFPKEVKEFRELSSSIKVSLTAQKKRIEGFLLSDRVIPYGTWRQSFSNHPLVGAVCKNLVWVFISSEGEFTAIYSDGKFIQADGLEFLPAQTVDFVRLWHPLTCNAEHLKKWQKHVMSKTLAQPFKQVFRESYCNIPSNVTALFSNIWVRQHQFRKTAVDLGWNYSFRGNFENFSTASKDFPKRCRCELEIKLESNLYSERGICVAVGLGDIIFYQDNKEVSAALLPTQLVSEILREIDFFVSISAVGNTADWRQFEADIRDSKTQEFYEYFSSDKSIDEYIKNGLNQKEIDNAAQLYSALTSAQNNLPIFKTNETRSALIGIWLHVVKLTRFTHVDNRYVYVRGTNNYKISISTGLIYKVPEQTIDTKLSKILSKPKKTSFIDQLSQEIIEKIEFLHQRDKRADLSKN
jgi:hypothetical protein